MIRITSKRDGFWRCGVQHYKKPTEHSGDRFSEEELERLNADPMLTVEEVEGVIAETPDLENMTVVALKVLLAKLEVDYDAKAKKSELIELVKTNTGEPPPEV